jgi:hypothetical protein
MSLWAQDHLDLKNLLLVMGLAVLLTACAASNSPPAPPIALRITPAPQKVPILGILQRTTGFNRLTRSVSCSSPERENG